MSSNSKINYNEALLIESYFKSQSINHYYLNVMNNHTLEPFADKNGNLVEDYQNMYIRKDHGYAHIVVTYYSNQNAKFRNFEERRYYYVSRLQCGDTLQIRKDLIERWVNSDVNNLYVLVLDESTNRVAEISAKVLCGAKHVLRQAQNLDFLWLFTLTADNLIWKHVDLVATDKEANALIAQWQYLGNVAYAKYRENTLIKIISYNNVTGAKRKSLECKSIKQAYDLLVGQGLIMNYKTFQRRCRSDKPSLVKTDKFIFYVTDKVDFIGEDYITLC